MRDVGDGYRDADGGSVPVPGAPDPVSSPARRSAYRPPSLVLLDLHMTQGITGGTADGAEGVYFTSGGGPA